MSFCYVVRLHKAGECGRSLIVYDYSPNIDGDRKRAENLAFNMAKNNSLDNHPLAVELFTILSCTGVNYWIFENGQLID